MFEENLVQSSSTTLSTRLNVPNSLYLKIKDGGGRYLKFRENVNNSVLDKYICTKFGGISASI